MTAPTQTLAGFASTGNALLAAAVVGSLIVTDRRQPHRRPL